MQEVFVFPDGSGGKNKQGGWSAVLIADDFAQILAGSEENTTNNRMEITAALRGLQALSKPSQVYLCSDSAYIVNSIQKGWYKRWLAEEDSCLRPNIDLWQAISAELKRHEVVAVKVRGHSHVEFNELADVTAVHARTSQSKDQNVSFDPENYLWYEITQAMFAKEE